MRVNDKNKKEAAQLLKNLKEAEGEYINPATNMPEPKTVTTEEGDQLPDIQGGLVQRVIATLEPDVADVIEKSVVAPEQDETPFEDINPGELTVSEAHTRISDGVLDKFSEAKLKMNEESKNDTVLKWVKDHGGFDGEGADDSEAFWAWAEQQGLQTKPNDPARPELANWTFQRIYKAFKREQERGNFNIDAWEPASARRAAPTRINHREIDQAPVERDPNYQPSETLANLMNISGIGDGEQIALTAADTVNQKYRAIKSKVKRVLSGRSLKNYFILCGDPGIGKSYLVNEVIEHMGIQDQVYYATGDAAGASRSSVGAFLYKTRHDPYIILDDSDSMIMKNVPSAVSNMLKGAMDSDRGHKVTITDSIAKQISKFMTDEDMDMELDDIQLDDDGNPIDQEEGTVPTTFSWEVPKMVMISNADESMISPALLSRSDYYELHLTQEEYLVRLAFVVEHLDLNKGRREEDIVYSDEEYNAAKDVVYETLVACIEAANHGIPLAGVQIKLTHSLEFRLLKTLVDDWLRLYEDYSDDGLEGEELQKAVMRDFIRTSVVPAL